MLKQNDTLDHYVASGDLLAYEYDDVVQPLYPNVQGLVLTFPSGRKLQIWSECGSEADASSRLEFGNPDMPEDEPTP